MPAFIVLETVIQLHECQSYWWLNDDDPTCKIHFPDICIIDGCLYKKPLSQFIFYLMSDICTPSVF